MRKCCQEHRESNCCYAGEMAGMLALAPHEQSGDKQVFNAKYNFTQQPYVGDAPHAA